jgi:hypothetical protein
VTLAPGARRACDRAAARWALERKAANSRRIDIATHLEHQQAGAPQSTKAALFGGGATLSKLTSRDSALEPI